MGSCWLWARSSDRWWWWWWRWWSSLLQPSAGHCRWEEDNREEKEEEEERSVTVFVCWSAVSAFGTVLLLLAIICSFSSAAQTRGPDIRWPVIVSQWLCHFKYTIFSWPFHGMVNRSTVCLLQSTSLHCTKVWACCSCRRGHALFSGKNWRTAEVSEVSALIWLIVAFKDCFSFCLSVSIKIVTPFLLFLLPPHCHTFLHGSKEWTQTTVEKQKPSIERGKQIFDWSVSARHTTDRPTVWAKRAKKSLQFSAFFIISIFHCLIGKNLVLSVLKWRVRSCCIFAGRDIILLF